MSYGITSVGRKECGKLNAFYCCMVNGFAAQERLRWKWSQSQNRTSFKGGTSVAEELLNFLDTHLANSSATVLADQRPRGYSVEMHHPALGGKSAAVKHCSVRARSMAATCGLFAVASFWGETFPFLFLEKTRPMCSGSRHVVFGLPNKTYILYR